MFAQRPDVLRDASPAILAGFGAGRGVPSRSTWSQFYRDIIPMFFSGPCKGLVALVGGGSYLQERQFMNCTPTGPDICLDFIEQMFYNPGNHGVAVTIPAFFSAPHPLPKELMLPALFDLPCTSVITLVQRTNNRFLRFGKGWCSDDFSRQQCLNSFAALGKPLINPVKSRFGIRIRRWISTISASLLSVRVVPQRTLKNPPFHGY